MTNKQKAIERYFKAIGWDEKDIKVREMLAEDPKIAQIFMFNMAEKLQKLL